jgi:hypothetical protein
MWLATIGFLMADVGKEEEPDPRDALQLYLF